MPSTGMKSFFRPSSVAVVGVSQNEEKLASIIFSNLSKNSASGLLEAHVFPVNPAHSEVFGVRCYPNVASLPEPPELTIVAVPAAQALGVVREAASAGTKAIILIPGGFAETGSSKLQTEVVKSAKERGARVLGPNTMGILDTMTGVDSLFLKPTKSLADGGEVVSHLKPRRGPVAIVTQSGHLGESVSEELTARGFGVRALVGTGNQADVSIEDVIEYFADDGETRVIAVYLEGVSDGQRFIRAVSRAARLKPVVVLKSGKTKAGSAATLTHTASMAGDYWTYQAAFRKAGAVEARDFQELVDLSIAFSQIPPASGKSLVVVTNAGGVGALAVDEAIASGLSIHRPSHQTLGRIRSSFIGSPFLANSSFVNPFDITASASTDEFVRVTRAALSAPEFDLGLLLPTHQTPAISPDVANALGREISRQKKPVAVCVIGWSQLADKIRASFASQGIPTFPTPERAVRALGQAGGWTPRTRAVQMPVARSSDSVKGLPQRGRLSAVDSARILSSYGIPQPRSFVVRSRRDLGFVRLTFPLVCKLISPELSHKSDVGGVILGVSDRDALRTAYRDLQSSAERKDLPFGGMLVQETVRGGAELILGSTRDAAFGPTLLFGRGGTDAEVNRDFSLSIAPLSARECDDAIARTKVGSILSGYRGREGVDLMALKIAISNFSRILLENPSISEFEVNPLIATPEGVYAVDARGAIAQPKESK